MSTNGTSDISCKFQRETDSGLLCELAQITSSDSTNNCDESVCVDCEIGKIYRIMRCNNVGGRLLIYEKFYLGSASPEREVSVSEIFCRKRKRTTSLDECRGCSLVSAETTKDIVERTTGLFESLGFIEATKRLDVAHRKINIEQDYDGAIREAVVSLESVLTGVLERMGVEPKDKTVTGLYGEVKKCLHFGDEFSSQYLMKVVGSISGAVTGLGAMRNELSDAHGKHLITPELYESYAELALNLSATMSTFVIRRYKEAHHNKTDFG